MTPKLTKYSEHQLVKVKDEQDQWLASFLNDSDADIFLASGNCVKCQERAYICFVCHENELEGARQSNYSDGYDAGKGEMWQELCGTMLEAFSKRLGRNIKSISDVTVTEAEAMPDWEILTKMLGDE